MNLTFEQIKEFAVGAVKITKEGDKIRLQRMPDELEAVYKELSPDWYSKSRCSTDCCLEFHTDSRHLRLDFSVDFIDSNTWAKYEIFVDGLPLVYVKERGDRHTVVASLPEGDKHVSVCLPCHNIGYIRNVTVDDGSYVKPHRFDRKFLFLGDSITQGYSADHDAQAYSCTVARYYNAASVNWAVGGARFREETVMATDFDPDVVFVAYGTNDYTHLPADTYLANCTAYLDKIKNLFGNKKVFVISPIWRADCEILRGAGVLDDCRALVAREAEKRGFIHVDGYRLVPHNSEYFSDGFLHPNDLGFAHYSRNLIQFLQPILK